MMNFLKGYVFFIIFVFLPGYSIFSQNTVNEEKSVNKISIDGELFYLHIVKEGQTLYSIAKTYQISEEEIIKNNPGTEYDIYPEQRLKIPVHPENNMYIENNTPTVQPDHDSTCLIYITKPGETVSYIADYYKISIDTLKYLNPGINEQLKAGTLVKIPFLDKVTSSDHFKLEEKNILYTVKKDDTLPSISKKYHVSVSSIILKNRELLWKGLKEGQIIDISIIDTIHTYPEEIFSHDSAKSDTAIIDSLITKPIDFYMSLLSGQKNYEINNLPTFSDSILVHPIKMVLLFPFHFNRIVELNTCIDTSNNKDQVRLAKRRRNELKITTDYYTDFYFGTLLALDSIKKIGISVDLSIYDTEGDSNVVRYLINKHNLKNAHIIIAPSEIPSINTILDYLGNTDVRIILPISKNKIKNQYKNVFYVNPSELILKEHYAHYLAQQYEKNIILVSNDDGASKLECCRIKKNILKYMSLYSSDSSLIKDIYYNDTLAQTIDQVLSDSINNIIAIISTKEAFISNVIREIYNIKGERIVSVMGNPGWIEMLQNNNLNTEYLHELNIIYFTPFYFDYSKDNIKQFLQQFRNEFKSEPYQHLKETGLNPVLFGYDISLFFISSIRKDFVKNNNPSSLLTNFEFVQKDPLGSYENISVTFISYEKNFDVVSFKPYQLK